MIMKLLKFTSESGSAKKNYSIFKIGNSRNYKFIKNFETNLLNQEFLVRTDCQAVKYIL